MTVSPSVRPLSPPSQEPFDDPHTTLVLTVPRHVDTSSRTLASTSAYGGSCLHYGCVSPPRQKAVVGGCVLNMLPACGYVKHSFAAVQQPPTEQPEGKNG